jgi:hypothetical protein
LCTERILRQSIEIKALRLKLSKTTGVTSGLIVNSSLSLPGAILCYAIIPAYQKKPPSIQRHRGRYRLLSQSLALWSAWLWL